MKEFVDENFEVNENGRKFSKRVENTAGKGEIACYKQFLLFPQCFQRLVLQTCKNQGLFGKGLICCNAFTKENLKLFCVFSHCATLLFHIRAPSPFKSVFNVNVYAFKKVYSFMKDYTVL